jgi:hypothetical protein
MYIEQRRLAMKKCMYRSLAVLSGVFILSSKTVIAGNGPPPSVNVPTLGEWGMIGTAAILGAAGVYTLLRRK